MIAKFLKNTAVLLALCIGAQAQAQTADTSKTLKPDTTKPAVKPEEKKLNTLNITADMRVRSEYRHGYRNLPQQDTTSAFFINQRTRLNFDYKTKGLDLYLSVQDSRVWGEQDPRAGHGTTSGITETPTTTFPIYLFEAYAQPYISDRWSLRIGRQRIVYDNQRLFAENDWRLAAASHDALPVIYNDKIRFTNEFIFAYGQSAENNYTTNYAPNGFRNYKVLINHYLNWKMSKNFTLTLLNTADGYQSSDPKSYKSTYMRYTNGGRIEYANYDWYLTLAGYYQHGTDSSARQINAYYLQPEIKYSGIKNLTIRAGAEYLSGQDTLSDNNNNFVPLYGVAHRFMGNMDFFTTFPTDVNNGGLINPYLFLQWQKKKWSVRMENHMFYSQTGAALKGKTETNKYLGFENDWRINYKANSFTDVEFGFCWASATNSLAIVRNPKATQAELDNFSKKPYWSYISVRFTPTIGKFTF